MGAGSSKPAPPREKYETKSISEKNKQNDKVTTEKKVSNPVNLPVISSSKYEKPECVIETSAADNHKEVIQENDIPDLKKPICEETTEVEEITQLGNESPGNSPQRARQINEFGSKPNIRKIKSSGRKLKLTSCNSFKAILSRNTADKREFVLKRLREALDLVQSDAKLSEDFDIQNLTKQIMNVKPTQCEIVEGSNSLGGEDMEDSLVGLVNDTTSKPQLFDNTAWSPADSFDNDDLGDSLESRSSCFSQLLSDIAGGGRRVVSKRDDDDFEVPEFNLLTSAAEVVGCATSDRQYLSKYICKEVNWLLKSGTCTIWWMDKETNQLTADVTAVGSTADASEDQERLAYSGEARRNSALIELSMPIPTEGPEAVVIKSACPVSLTTVRASKHKHTEKLPVTEVVYAPIKMDGEVVGVCKCCNKLRSHGTEFSDDDINLLSAFLIFASACSKNCFLYRDLKKSHGNTQRLLDMTQHLGEHSLNATKLCESIMHTANDLLNSESNNLYLMSDDGKGLQTVVNGSLHTFDINTGIEGYVARSGEVVRTNEALNHPHYSDSLDKLTDRKTTSILCAPILRQDKVIAVTQLVNKNDLNGFTIEDEKTFVGFNTFCGAHLGNAFEHRRVLEERKTNLRLVEAAESLQRVDIMNMSAIQMKVKENAKIFMPCEASDLWMVEKERNRLVNVARPIEAIQLEETIIQPAVMSGTRAVFGIDDKSVAIQSDLICRHIPSIRQLLCLPIKSLDDEVIFVSVLCNRDSETGFFSSSDLHMMDIFISFASMCLRTSSLVQFMKSAGDARSRLMRLMGQPQKTQSVLTHKAGTIRKLKDFVDSPSFRAKAECLTKDEMSLLLKPEFPIHNYNISNATGHGRLPRLAVELFYSFNVPQEFSVTEAQILQFVKVVQRKYRNVPYHNFTHAFDVTQALCVYLKLMPEGKYLTNLERFALIVTALCHDIDHMGLNNSFQLKAETPLGVLSRYAKLFFFFFFFF